MHNVMCRIIFVFVLIITIILFTTVSYSEDTWLLSETSCIKIGAWLKYGNLPPSSVKFIVAGPKGKIYEKSVAYNNDWVYVVFPFDFEQEYAPPGNYTWKCISNNKSVVSGAFTYSNDQLKVGKHR